MIFRIIPAITLVALFEVIQQIQQKHNILCNPIRIALRNPSLWNALKLDSPLQRAQKVGKSFMYKRIKKSRITEVYPSNELQ